MNIAPAIETIVAQKSAEDGLWFKDAIVYQLHVKVFQDSNGDGVGDFAGLTQRLGYLRDLGVTTLWLQPFYPSPGRDDGYDISDYGDINPAFGSMKDFRRFMQEAKRNDLRVIIELVVNHTSDQHPWFKRAKRSGRGTSARAARRPVRPSATSMSGVTRPIAIATRASSSRTSSRRTGRGIRSPSSTTGTASSPTSPI